MQTITENEFDNLVLGSNTGKVIVDFYAPWCGPCKALAPTLEEYEEENQDVKTYKINIDENESLVIKYQIELVPTLIFLQDGIELEKISGIISKDQIDNVFNK